MDHRPKYKTQTTKLLENDIKENLDDLVFRVASKKSDAFLDATQKT